MRVILPPNIYLRRNDRGKTVGLGVSVRRGTHSLNGTVPMQATFDKTLAKAKRLRALFIKGLPQKRRFARRAARVKTL